MMGVVERGKCVEGKGEGVKTKVRKEEESKGEAYRGNVKRKR